jgi:UDP-N-acetylmuramyl pentapeptide phosphotransferase/UDP-N-acetylglucosamine-1-phosphate transferase
VRLHEAVDGAARIGAGVVSGLMIALWANFFNLLDVRPGRAGTLFMLMALPCAGLLTMQGDRVDGWVLWGVIVGLLMVLPLDRAGRGMLGDTGSNLLGGVLGTSLALLMPLWLQGLVVVGLLLIHLWAESHSLTEWLERHPLLRRLDRLTGVR